MMQNVLGPIHTTHGMMLQEVESANSTPIVKHISTVDRTKEKYSFIYKQ